MFFFVWIYNWIIIKIGDCIIEYDLFDLILGIRNFLVIGNYEE